MKLAARENPSCLSHTSLHAAGGRGSLSYIVHASLRKRGLSESMWQSLLQSMDTRCVSDTGLSRPGFGIFMANNEESASSSVHALLCIAKGMLTYMLWVHCQAATTRMIFEICSVITYIVTLVIHNCPANASLFTMCCEGIAFVHYLAAPASVTLRSLPSVLARVCGLAWGLMCRRGSCH